LREEAEEADHEVGGVGEDEVSVGATRQNTPGSSGGTQDDEIGNTKFGNLNCAPK
jgi:hypothetical protein